MTGRSTGVGTWEIVGWTCVLWIVSPSVGKFWGGGWPELVKYWTGPTWPVNVFFGLPGSVLVGWWIASFTKRQRGKWGRRGR